MPSFKGRSPGQDQDRSPELDASSGAGKTGRSQTDSKVGGANRGPGKRFFGRPKRNYRVSRKMQKPGGA